jgi:hypothetical protein
LTTKLLAVEREPTGTVVLGVDRGDPRRPDQDVVDVAAHPPVPVGQGHRVQHPPPWAAPA